MNHSNIEELLSAYTNGEISRTQRDFVDEHLAGCPDCRATLADHSWVRRQLTSLQSAPIESNIREATMLKIEATQALKWPLPALARPALIAAAIVAAVMVPLLLQLSGASPGGPIARAYAATAALHSYRMSGATAQVFNGVASETTFEHEFTAPDRYHISMVADGETREFIIIGDRQYARVSGGQSSRNVVEIVIEGGFSVFNPTPSREGTLQLLDSLADLQKLGDAKIDDAETLHYKGRVDVDRIVDEQVAALDPQSPVYRETVEFLDLQRSIRIDVELWIGLEDDSIRRMKLDGQSPTTGTGPDGDELIGSSSFSTVVTYSDFDEPMEIEGPLTPSGDLKPEWSLVSSG